MHLLRCAPDIKYQRLHLQRDHKLWRMSAHFNMSARSEMGCGPCHRNYYPQVGPEDARRQTIPADATGHYAIRPSACAGHASTRHEGAKARETQTMKEVTIDLGVPCCSCSCASSSSYCLPSLTGPSSCTCMAQRMSEKQLALAPECVCQLQSPCRGHAKHKLKRLLLIGMQSDVRAGNGM